MTVGASHSLGLPLHFVQVPEYLRGFQGADSREFADAWNQSVDRRLPPPLLPMLPESGHFSELEGIWQQASPSITMPILDGQWPPINSGISCSLQFMAGN